MKKAAGLFGCLSKAIILLVVIELFSGCAAGIVAYNGKVLCTDKGVADKLKKLNPRITEVREVERNFIEPFMVVAIEGGKRLVYCIESVFPFGYAVTECENQP